MHIHLGIGVIVFMTSTHALGLNIVTQGPVIISQFFDLCNLAGIIAIVLASVWRMCHGLPDLRTNINLIKILFAGLIGNALGMIVVVSVVLCIEPKRSTPPFLLALICATATAFLMRRISLRRLNELLAVEGANSTT